MKLYTEEQVVQAMSLAVSGDYDMYNEILEQLTPIELPSDEEIGLVALKSDTLNNKFDFYIGAKWMKEQILNQNK